MNKKIKPVHFLLNLKKLENRIDTACLRAKVPRSNIKTLAVSKKKSVEEIEIAISNGIYSFGENYLSEAIEKINFFSKKQSTSKIEWHFIGSIQKNKTRKISENFDWVHSIDRFEIAQRLSEQRPSELLPLKIFIQLNIDNEEFKSGVSSNDIFDLVKQVHELPNISLQGLMAIPKPSKNFDSQRLSLSKLRRIKDEINRKNIIDLKINKLSMGMSQDLEAAVYESDNDCETWLRIGSALFGERV